MRIIKTSTLRSFWQVHRDAEASLRTWVGQTKAARWRGYLDVRATFNSVDLVTVASGRQVVIFNIAHNRYRLVAAVHFNTRIVYTLRIVNFSRFSTFL